MDTFCTESLLIFNYFCYKYFPYNDFVINGSVIMKWIVVLVCVIVLSEILSIADGQIQLTVDVAGGTKTLVNIRSEASDIPPDVTRTGALSRKKRASAIRPFSTGKFVNFF